MKILIVEDNPDGREIVVLYVRSLGYEVFEAATGIEGLDQARAIHPDLILMDLVLPEMPGHEVIARLKADPSTREIPVIVLTALSRGSPSGERARRGDPPPSFAIGFLLSGIAISHRRASLNRSA